MPELVRRNIEETNTHWENANRKKATHKSKMIENWAL